MSEQNAASAVPDGITISFTRQQIHEFSIFFMVRIQVSLGGHRVSWDTTMASGATVLIELDSTQKLTLLVREDELLVDSSQVARDFPVTLEERAIQ